MTCKIRDVRVFLTAPDGQNLVVVRVETDQSGLYGLGGCATNAYRAYAVREVIEDCFRPLLIGRDATRMEDTWKHQYQNSYWRGGPVLNAAVSGIDMALWDILAKLAGLPLYTLPGGTLPRSGRCLQALQCFNRRGDLCQGRGCGGGGLPVRTGRLYCLRRPGAGRLSLPQA